MTNLDKSSGGRNLHCRDAFFVSAPPEPPEFLGSWNWREPAPGETLRAWTERKARQIDELVALGWTWVQIGLEVRILHAPHLGRDFDGRKGVITALGGLTFPDYVFVRLVTDLPDDDPKALMIGLESLEPFI
jgi:hypothetical protein